MKEKFSRGKKTRVVTRAARRAARIAEAPAAVVTVTFRHVESTPAIRLYAERKLAHVSRYLKRACDVHVILTVDKYRQHGEVTVKSGRLALTAQEETKDLYSAIDLLAANVERQLKRHIEKLLAKKTRAASTGEALVAAEQADSDSSRSG